MKLPLSLIRSFIPVSDDLSETLTLLGIEVDSVHNSTCPFEGVVVGKVLQTHKHPAADKLNVATVTDGQSQYQVVCGAPNCREGLIVAFAKIGAKLPGLVIEKTSIRGVESFGMLCSSDELNLYEDPTGILELPLEFPLGKDCKELLWDPVYEISLTPNLGHCMSALGIARELAASRGINFKLNLIEPLTKNYPLKISVEPKQIAPLYSAVVIDNIEISESPYWLKSHLRLAGICPKNNVVDVTNWVLLKYGQPLHAYDFSTFEGDTVRVKTLVKEEVFSPLIGEKITISPGTLVVQDGNKILALAGVMGSIESGIKKETKKILLEAACFDPKLVRISSKNSAIRSDSSLRFEKGIDPAILPSILAEAATLIAHLCKGNILGSTLIRSSEFAHKKIKYRLSKINQILGVKLSQSEVESIFYRLGFETDSETVFVPYYRHDVQEEIDLIEEVGRIFGFNNIEKEASKSLPSDLPHSQDFLFEKNIRTKAVGLGFTQFQHCDLISPKLAQLSDKYSLTPKKAISVLHSKSEEYSVLRPSLLPSMLETAKRNIDKNNSSICAFEIGKVFFKVDSTIEESSEIAFLMTGKTPTFWQTKSKAFDFYDLKGSIETFLDSLRLNVNLKFVASKHPSFHPYAQANLFVDDQHVGSLGEIHPELTSLFGIEQKVLYAEINIQILQKRLPGPVKVKPLPLYPSSERDWTTDPLPRSLPISVLFEAIDQSKGPLLESAQLIDLYQEKNTATFRFTYRDHSKTLSYDEVELAHHRLLEKVKEALNNASIEMPST
jgi:phenylalanyl-tRNA synthetase beta chain